MSDKPILVEINIALPAGTTVTNIYRNARDITIQMWATPEAKDLIVTSFTSYGDGDE